ncbi:hypothetical protein [Streptomyces sp. NPDC026589]|uniref:hypothetical protein n=1 Tax=Streptomyces sp. NPDC026589 TaxID=3155609 RepID=UPI0033E0ABF7
MTSPPPPRPAARSYDGEGIVVRFDAHRCLQADGVPHVRGDLEVATPRGPRHETRVMLRGCGATGNTPYCDHSGPCAGHG